MLDVQKIRKDFPIFSQSEYNGKPLIYLDSTATALKPQSVIDAELGYYTSYSANVFRGIYKISEKATSAYEASRALIAAFIGAKTNEIIFTRNTSESINLLYYALVKNSFASDSEIVTTIMEHHSNFVPWQQWASQGLGKLKIWKCDENGQLNVSDLRTLITRKTKLLTITHASNVLGTINPINEIVMIVKTINPKCLVLVDAAQSAPHMPIDIQELGADFVVFSAHKMVGPTGVGVLWGKQELMENLSPFMYGGDMISEVHEHNTVFNSVPHRFEAGTPNIAGVIGLGAAVKYLSTIGMNKVREHEYELVTYALEKMQNISGIAIYGPKREADRGGVISFTLKGVHPHDIAQIVDDENICIRVGYHCAQPLHEHLGTGPTARASFYIYNTQSDVDALVSGLANVKKIFKV